MAETPTEYRVRLPIFEGPFDLLLHLVKINEMEITDISLALLTRQYLEFLEKMQAMNLDVAGEFLVVAATLIQIKARYLLPRDGAEEEEEEEEIDELLSARELMQQLIEYRSYKEIIAELEQLEARSTGVFYRSRMPELLDQAEADNPVQGDLDLLFEAMAGVLRYIERRDPHTALYEKYTVEDKIEFLSAKLDDVGRLDVVREFERCLNKMEIIVTFLALLELVRLKRVRIEKTDDTQVLEIRALSESESEETAADDATNEENEPNEQEKAQEKPSEAPTAPDGRRKRRARRG